MHNVEEYVEFTNSRGDSVRFELVSIEGLGDVGANIQQQRAPFQDGSTYLDAILEPRYIEAEFIVRGTDYDEVRANRTSLASVINPKLGLGTLTYYSGDTVRLIDAVAESVPAYADRENRGVRWQRGIVTFVAPNPYWKSIGITEEPAFEPRFRFPIPFYDNPGKFIMGLQRDQRVIFNDGDAPAPLHVEFFGPAVNPKIINNTTGEFIKIRQTLEEGEKMVIDTADGVKSVFFIDAEGNGRNVFNWIDPDSVFFKLVVGDNDIEYTADNDVQGAIVNISYSKQYVGV